MMSLQDRLVKIGRDLGQGLQAGDRQRWQPAIEAAASLASELIEDRLAGRDTQDKELDLKAQWANIGVGALLITRRRLGDAWAAAFREVFGFALSLIPEE